MRSCLRLPLYFCAHLIAGCGSQTSAPIDLNATDLSTHDLAVSEDLTVPFDSTSACVPQMLLDGTSTPEMQGWSATGDTSTVNADGVLINFKTEGVSGASSGTSAFILYRKDIGIADGTSYALEWRLKLGTSDGHNQLDSPVAFLASFTPPFGVGNQRSEMIYFDVAAIGWADDRTGDKQRYAVDTTKSLHVYRLDVTATGHAEVRVDGTLALTRESFTTNGFIAIGDQTNESNVDSQFSVYSIRKLCP